MNACPTKPARSALFEKRFEKCRALMAVSRRPLRDNPVSRFGHSFQHRVGTITRCKELEIDTVKACAMREGLRALADG